MCLTQFLDIKLFIRRQNLHFFIVTLFQTSPCFLCVCSTSLLKTLWEKDKLIVMSNFSFSHSDFYRFGELSAIFIEFKIVIANSYQFGSLKFVVWERVLNSIPEDKIYTFSN